MSTNNAPFGVQIDVSAKKVMQIKDYSREELDYHQSENNYTLSIPKKFLNVKNIKVKKKNQDGSYSDADVEIRNEEREILIITTIPIDIRVEISDEDED